MRALLFMGLILVLFGVIMLVMKRAKHLVSDQKNDTPSNFEAEHTQTVRCARCGAYLPTDKAVQTDDGPICPEH
jgi:formylmethanofuran dehydrogenase subunit E